MEAVCRMVSWPYWPTEAIHSWWGESTREVEPSGSPSTSCAGFSWTTWGLEGLFVSSEGESCCGVICVTTQITLWDHCLYWKMNTNHREFRAIHSTVANLWQLKPLQTFPAVAVSKYLLEAKNTGFDWMRHLIFGHAQDVTRQTTILVSTIHTYRTADTQSQLTVLSYSLTGMQYALLCLWLLCWLTAGKCLSPD